MLRISSIIFTVLPTPAPPNNPTLPPFAKGQIKSITLIPVSSNSVAGERSVNAGASRWITILSSSPIGPFSSIGSPNTFMIRPRVLTPTGTFSPSPVFSTTIPRRNPSLVPRAMVLTTLSPSCCCTSNVTLLSSIFNASYILGTASLGNLTSTTAPITCTTSPELILKFLLFAYKSLC